MAAPKTFPRDISIEDLYVNPENYRYIEPAKDEISAIIAMFRVPNGKPRTEMVNLANDIAENGLNPFEFPVVSYDDDIEKYIVIEGNRRITCIKLMTQYNGNQEILDNVPSVKRIYNKDYNGNIRDDISCIVYEDVEEAKMVLSKIHQDVNKGIGRKQWDPYAKHNAKAHEGNMSKTFSIINFVKGYEKADKKLIDRMNTARWTSKLEKVITFACFRETYEISFDKNNRIIAQDSDEHVYKMMARLIDDMIDSSAQDIRSKEKFDQYTDSLPDEYKTHKSKSKKAREKTKKEEEDTKKEEEKTKKEEDTKKEEKETEKKTSDTADEPHEPKSNLKKVLLKRRALRLSRDYDEKKKACLGEKGKNILGELESLNYYQYEYASTALCRSIIEYSVKKWSEKNNFEFSSKDLRGSFLRCIDSLCNKKMITDKQNKTLRTTVNKENYIDMLNSWIHSDSLLCVKLETLENGWKACRILLELYIQNN